MEPTEPLYPFTLALSYLEKCDSEIANWRRVRETRELDNTQYDAVLSTYASHRRQAEAFVEELRQEAREALAREEPQLDELVGELRRTSRAATKGVIKPAKANRISRRIQKRLAPLQERIHLHQTIAEVGSSAALGGPIELPLDDFAPRLRKWVALPPPEAKKPKRAASKERRELNLKPLLIFAAMVVVAVLYYGYPAAQSRPPAFGILPAGDRVQVICVNRSGGTVYFYAPWPDGHADTRGRSPSGASYGVRLFVRETRESTWRMLPVSDGAWSQQGEMLLEPGPYRVEANTSKAFDLDSGKLRIQGVEAEQFRVEVVRAGGTIVEERVVD